MPTKKQDEQFAVHLPGLLSYHARMLSDGVRNDLLRRAIEKSVNRNTSFLEVGAGSGVWAILAAKLSAKRVVAVEIDDALIPVIFKLAEENQVADRIEIIHGNIDDVKLRGKFDVIVCELFGRNAFGSKVVKSVIKMRKRFLAAGGILIPQKLEMYAVPLLSGREGSTLRPNPPVSGKFLRSLLLNYAEEVPLAESAVLKFAAAPQKLVEIDFRSIKKPLDLVEYSAVWKLKDISRINSFGVFSKSLFSDGMELDSRRSKSWNLAKYNFEPFDVKVGEIRFGINLDPHKGSWTISLPSNPEITRQSYSPVFAFTRARMAQAATPYKEFGRPNSSRNE